MSIFKGTIEPFVAAQLNARKKIIQQEQRDSLFMSYTTAKNGWSKLSSFVNAEIPQRNSKGVKINGVPRYTGDELARKYVLLGGTLYQSSPSSPFALRGGVGQDGSVYGSDIDKAFSQFRTGNTNFQGAQNRNVNNIYSDRPFGIRPMPGISSVNIINKSAYGSLREATIKYYCWDKFQLEELELLYMRVGYSCLLEWGWSQYLTYDRKAALTGNINNISFDKYPIASKTFPPDGFLDPFQKTYKVQDPKSKAITNAYVNDTYFYNEIYKNVEEHKGNYDSMLGIIKNFSWQLLPNGGYECTTILISRGEVLSSLRLTNNGDPKTTAQTVSNSNNSEPPLTTFEKIFYNLQGYLNNKEINDAVGSFHYSASGGGVPPPPPPGFKTTQVIDATTTIVLNKIKSALTDNKTYNAFRDTFGNTYTPYVSKDFSAKSIADEFGVTTYINGSSTEGTGNEYISLNLLIYILNAFFTLKDESKSSNGGDSYFVKILLPQKTPILASTNSVSVDPTTCLIKNPKATLITNGNATGFTPNFYYADGSAVDPSHIKDFLMSNGRGDLGAIYVSIDKLTTLFKESNSGADGVIMIDYIQTLLDDISAALGGINDFKIYVSDNTAQIFDAKYLEDDSATAVDSKFKLDLFGLKSICRDVRITSRIFEEQSTMIAIGAVNQGNIGDIYSSTYNYLNDGLQDRLHPTTTPTVASIQALAVSLFSDLRTLFDYLKNKCIGDINNDPARAKNYTLAVNPEEVPTAASIYKTFQLRISGEDIDYKDLIPFELEITLDGIAGFIQGQIIRIDNTVLPRDYINKKVGLIITGISHSLQNNDWTTTLKTQICLLDQAALKAANPNAGLQAKLIKQLQALITLNRKNDILWSAYADYLTYLTVGAFKYYLGPTNDNALVQQGDYVTSAGAGMGKTTANLSTFATFGSVENTDEILGRFISGDPDNSGANRAKYYYFNTYYENIWYPNASSASAIPADVRNDLPTPAEVNASGRGRTYLGYKYKKIDPTTGNVVDDTLKLDLNDVVINGGTYNQYGVFPYDNYKNAHETAGSDIQFKTTFLNRRNQTTLTFKPFQSTRNDGYVSIPIHNASDSEFIVVNHPYVTSPSTFDIGRILVNGNILYCDVNQILRDNQTYVKLLGSRTEANNTTILPPEISPNRSTFLGYSVEVERIKNVFVDPTVNPTGALPIAIIKK
jgi:hypothetical protein